MNKQAVKWTKRIGIAIGSIIAIFLLYVVSIIGYQELYIPHHIETLYQEGLTNPSKAEWVVKQLQNIEDIDGIAEKKVLTLIKTYAQKENLWAQIALEQYNEEHEIPIESIIPINKYIWGITLGKSTKQDIWNYLDSKDLWHQELKNGSITQVYKSFEFAGIFWNYVNYKFTNNKVYEITFVCNTKGSAEEYFSILKNMLMTKYTISKGYNIECPTKLYIIDSNTLIELILDYSSLYLTYTDLRLAKKKYQKNINSI